jgi:hypothetical protein
MSDRRNRKKGGFDRSSKKRGRFTLKSPCVESTFAAERWQIQLGEHWLRTGYFYGSSNQDRNFRF